MDDTINSEHTDSVLNAQNANDKFANEVCKEILDLCDKLESDEGYERQQVEKGLKWAAEERGQ